MLTPPSGLHASPRRSEIPRALQRPQDMHPVIGKRNEIGMGDELANYSYVRYWVGSRRSRRTRFERSLMADS
jgi:hypothetical protein